MSFTWVHRWKTGLGFPFPPGDLQQQCREVDVRAFRQVLGTVVVCGLAVSLCAGPDGAPIRSGTAAPDTSTFRGIAGKRIGLPAGMGGGYKEAPLPSPYRPIGWGFNCQEFYGPTYYYPWYHNTYESLHPTYYPFYHPRLWPNYKTDAQYCTGKYCGASRSLWYWDSYDDWMRGGRYEQHQ